MAETIDYSLNFGSIPRAPSREAVRLRMQAEAVRSRAQRALTLRARDPWLANPALLDDSGEEAEKHDCRDEIV